MRWGLLIREVTRKAETVKAIRRGQTYPFLRRAQKRITMGDFRRLSDFFCRDTFMLYAQYLTRLFFPKSVQKNLAVVPEIENSNLSWLINSPLIRRRRGILHHDWSISHALTWLRQVCNPTTQQWFYCSFDLELPDDPVEAAVINSEKYLDVRDIYWLEESFKHALIHAKSDRARGKIAKQILYPFVFIDIDDEMDSIFRWKATGDEKRRNRASKIGSCSYLRNRDRVHVFATATMRKRYADRFEWTDVGC